MTTTTKFTPRPLKRVARCISTATLEFYIPREESGPSEERLALRRLLQYGCTRCLTPGSAAAYPAALYRWPDGNRHRGADGPGALLGQPQPGGHPAAAVPLYRGGRGNRPAVRYFAPPAAIIGPNRVAFLGPAALYRVGGICILGWFSPSPGPAPQGPRLRRGRGGRCPPTGLWPACGAGPGGSAENPAQARHANPPTIHSTDIENKFYPCRMTIDNRILR